MHGASLGREVRVSLSFSPSVCACVWQRGQPLSGPLAGTSQAVRNAGEWQNRWDPSASSPLFPAPPQKKNTPTQEHKSPSTASEHANTGSMGQWGRQTNKTVARNHWLTLPPALFYKRRRERERKQKERLNRSMWFPVKHYYFLLGWEQATEGPDWRWPPLACLRRQRLSDSLAYVRHVRWGWTGYQWDTLSLNPTT